jgi:NAD(P)-dependent dehydrogenase (short-subunit alcohol dehydrogenase family)
MNTKKILELVSLEGKVAVISGGASGIGFGTAKRLVEFGAKVAILDVNDENGENAVREITALNGEATYLHCDITKLDQCKTAINSIINTYSKIDILFNNAGIAVRKNVVDLEPDEWDLALNVSLKGQYLLSKCVIPFMKKNGGGSIINSGSGWSFRGGENAVAYCAMKGGSLLINRDLL